MAEEIYKKIRLSHEWIYQYILKDKSQAGDLYTYLRLRKNTENVTAARTAEE